MTRTGTNILYPESFRGARKEWRSPRQPPPSIFFSRSIFNHLDCALFPATSSSLYCDRHSPQASRSQCICVSLSCNMSGWGFTNPPNMAKWNDFSDNPVYVEGSSVNIVWQAPTNIATSVTCYQANLTDGYVIGDFEYITSVFFIHIFRSNLCNI